MVNMKKIYINSFLQNVSKKKILRYSNKYKLKKYIKVLFLIFLVTVIVVYVLKAYKTYLKTRKRFTVFDLDNESKACIRMNLDTEFQKPSIAASFGGGRTANQLCEFATGYALWRQFGILNYIDNVQYEKLKRTFDLPELNENDNSSSYYIWNEGE